MRLMRTVGRWLDARLQLGGPVRATLQHQVPRSSASWAYVFGSAALTVLGLQIVTGVLLALIYVPSAGEARASLQLLNHQIALGWFVRALHGWGSNAMVAIVLVHMAQVFLFGAHKYPRELTWIIGVFLLLCTFGMAFTGQILRFDQDAYWGLGIGASIMSRVPVIGPALVPMLLGGPIISGATLSRFFAIHVFIVPGLLVAFVAIHLLLVLKLGINEWPMPGRVVRRETYLRDYHELTQRDGIPFVPDAIGKDIVFSGVVLLAIAACAYGLGPFGPSGEPNPTIIETSPRPDFFFLWLFALLSLLPPAAETPLLLVAPPLIILLLLAVPFIAGQGEKSWRRRPVALLAVLMAVVTLGTLTRLADDSPWSPVMDAWSSAPVPHAYLAGRTALERRGALVFQVKQCRNCHAIGVRGGQRGPALDDVAVRLTPDQLIRQVVQGGGNMPAYGRNLSFAETTALVAFLVTLHPATESPARDPSQDPPRAADRGQPARGR